MRRFTTISLSFNSNANSKNPYASKTSAEPAKNSSLIYGGIFLKNGKTVRAIVPNLMLDNKKGGINYLTDSTHQPTNKNSHWESGGDNAFIKLLSQAYLNVIGQQNQLVQPKQLNLFDQQEDFTKPCNDAPF